jgi:hypothetical protein
MTDERPGDGPDDIANNEWVAGTLFLEEVPPEDAARTLRTFRDMLSRAPEDRAYQIDVSVPHAENCQLSLDGLTGSQAAQAIALMADVIESRTDRLTIDQEIIETQREE